MVDSPCNAMNMRILGIINASLAMIRRRWIIEHAEVGIDVVRNPVIRLNGPHALQLFLFHEEARLLWSRHLNGRVDVQIGVQRAGSCLGGADNEKVRFRSHRHFKLRGEQDNSERKLSSGGIPQA